MSDQLGPHTGTFVPPTDIPGPARRNLAAEFLQAARDGMAELKAQRDAALAEAAVHKAEAERLRTAIEWTLEDGGSSPGLTVCARLMRALAATPTAKEQ